MSYKLLVPKKFIVEELKNLAREIKSSCLLIYSIKQIDQDLETNTSLQREKEILNKNLSSFKNWTKYLNEHYYDD